MSKGTIADVQQSQADVQDGLSGRCWAILYSVSVAIGDYLRLGAARTYTEWRCIALYLYEGIANTVEQ